MGGLIDGVHRHADADQADDGAVRTADRCLRADRIAEGALLHRQFGLATADGGRIGAQRPVQLRRVGMCDAIAGVVGDHDEQHPGAGGDGRGLPLQRGGGQLRGGGRVAGPARRRLGGRAGLDLLIRGHRLRDGLGAAREFGSGLGVGAVDDDAETGGQAGGHDHHLQDQDLRA